MNRRSTGLAALVGTALAVSTFAVSGAAAAVVSAPRALWVSAGAASDPACGAASQANPFRTLAAALACARDGVTIHLGAGQFAGEVTVAVNATLVGVGPATVIADPSGSADLTPELTITSGHTVALSRMHIDGADASGNPLHAGIRSGAGSLTLQQVTISGTVATKGAGIDTEPGAADATVTVQNSTIDNGFALQGGGAILLTPTTTAGSTLTLLNSTLTGNQANSLGGAIYLANSALISRESTITNNSAATGGGLYLTPTPDHTATLTGTILAANTATTAPDCYATGGATTPLNSGGHNLIGQDTGTTGTGCPGFTNNTNNDQVGAPGAPIDPVLGPLANHGGPTPTRAPLTGSPAIGTGNTTDCQTPPINNLDQRGKPRHADTRNTCDIGAYDTGGTA